MRRQWKVNVRQCKPSQERCIGKACSLVTSAVSPQVPVRSAVQRHSDPRLGRAAPRRGPQPEGVHALERQDRQASETAAGLVENGPRREQADPEYPVRRRADQTQAWAARVRTYRPHCRPHGRPHDCPSPPPSPPPMAAPRFHRTHGRTAAAAAPLIGTNRARCRHATNWHQPSTLPAHHTLTRSALAPRLAS